ncbi:MAG: Maf family protein [Candidatus Obscuribacterales bacterium]|nr:Maf family protein [Candidatus Obscuribacterales bacterium]
MRIVLASASPRRLDLLSSLGLRFDVVPSDVDENIDLTDPAEFVRQLSLVKAEAVAAQLTNGPALVLGADTIVVLKDQILGKPTSRENAFAMLSSLSGNCHQVFTGVSLLESNGSRRKTLHRVSNVYFRPLNPDEIRHYINTDEPMDKAGSYALQGLGSSFVEKIDGCYTNIIGLPVPDTLAMLREFGVKILGLP